MDRHDPFGYPIRRKHFFKRYDLDDYPIDSSFGFAGNAFMAIFIDGSRKIIVNWPLNLDFIPRNYSPGAYILLYFLNANSPPVMFAEDRVDIWNMGELSELDKYLTKYAPTVDQITLTLPRMTTDSVFRSL